MLVALLSPEMQSIALAYALMLIVPGPSLLIVVQAGLSAQRSHGLWTALGVATGASMLAMALAFSTAYFPLPDAVIKAGRLICILVLLLTGFRALSFRTKNEGQRSRPSPATGVLPFGIGLFTAMANPISLAFFASSAFSFAQQGDYGRVAPLPLVVFVMALTWYGGVGLALARPRFSVAHRGIFRIFSLGSGFALVLMAAAMALSA
jgi:threonine efflux protein